MQISLKENSNAFNQCILLLEGFRDFHSVQKSKNLFINERGVNIVGTYKTYQIIFCVEIKALLCPVSYVL